MKTMTVAVFVALAIAMVCAEAPVYVPILQLDDVRDEHGQYSLQYVTGDGTTLTESGKLVPNDEGDGHVLIKEGIYSYTAPEGNVITVKYVADKNGFQPVGDHLPVAPVA
ncbi:hypothetical protein J437_LFUL016865 [Ladona fulva]|uniref:Uncharacterized protein n=1 Tax=Ladona fulva TaxID=123851 RepID=A0A8K0KQN5_LADFU|nr:hypothetical protein J437_LFUL016865 [Ladona fulva]